MLYSSQALHLGTLREERRGEAGGVWGVQSYGRRAFRLELANNAYIDYNPHTNACPLHVRTSTECNTMGRRDVNEPQPSCLGVGIISDSAIRMRINVSLYSGIDK